MWTWSVGFNPMWTWSASYNSIFAFCWSRVLIKITIQLSHGFPPQPEEDEALILLFFLFHFIFCIFSLQYLLTTIYPFSSRELFLSSSNMADQLVAVFCILYEKISHNGWMLVLVQASCEYSRVNPVYFCEFTQRQTLTFYLRWDFHFFRLSRFVGFVLNLSGLYS